MDVTGAISGYKINNLGGRDIFVDKIEVRRVNNSLSSVYYYRLPSRTEVIGDMNITSPTKLNGMRMTLY